MFEHSKAFLVAALAPIIAATEPIQNLLFAVTILYFVNLAVGVIEDIYNKKDPPNIKKFLISLLEASVYMLTLVLVFQVAKIMEEADAGVFVAKMITWLVLYWYAQNVIKNLVQIAPNFTFFKFLDFLLNVRFLSEKLPFYKDFLKWKNETNPDPTTDTDELRHG